ncbi:TPA: hypothetical protein U5Y67_000090 [Streptococcus agalactiae]|nr:hypothetical protein [Streptococcus agalactiae]HEN4303147.1 hypothetical protein [Streptococcus agalactiae]
MSTEFEKLNTEIDRYLDLLLIIENSLIGIESYDAYKSFSIEIIDKDETESIFKSMKSNMILMLYNLVEATVRNTMNTYYDKFNRKNLSYLSVVEQIKKLWIQYNIKELNQNQFGSQIPELINSAINNEYYLSLDFEKNFSLSGNADVREIKNILNRHGIQFDDKLFSDYGRALKSIKDMRNSLAHGNISFEDNGRNIAVSDLIAYKQQTYVCLTQFIKLVDESEPALIKE